MIEYVLKINELTGEGKKYNAQVVNSRSYTFDDIAKHLIKHNTGLSSAAIYGLWEGIKGAVEEFISEGASVNTELFHTSASIKGVFDSMDDGFDSSRHKIRLNLQPGLLLRNIQEKLRARKVNAGAQGLIRCVTDINSGRENEILSPGKTMRITGLRLKIDGTDPSCGLYFIPEKSTGTPVKVEQSGIVVNRPSEIIAVIPKLGKGNWSLRLITQFSRGKVRCKKPINITCAASFSVA